ncbi:uncharacterized protein LOC135844670 [Planococcus citri]|uniref:uncharacterized protein LOC135844670 n=1 Tax=Planococcus citri TaxID=170843 RepID=UPI0031F7FBE7
MRHFIFAIFHLLCVISTTKFFAEEDEVRNRSPLLLAHYKGSYEFPKKVYITEKDQIQEYFYKKVDDVAHYCPSEEEPKEKTNNNEVVDKAAESVEENEDRENKVEESKDAEKTPTSLESSNDDLKYQYCLFEKKFDNKEEKTICAKEVKPLIIENKKQDGKVENCGSESRLLYKFAYQICVKKSALQKLTRRKKANKYADVQYPSTYEICYDHTKNRVIFTKHSIKSAYMLRNLRLDGEHALHDFSKRHSTETYGLGNLKKLENILEAYRLQGYLPEDERNYHLIRLVPKEDFALGHWIKTTLHIINYSLQHKSKVHLWELINSHIRFRLIKLYEKIPDAEIYTGTWGELKDDETERRKYLGNSRKLGITIPLIWWKLLYSAKRREAIVIIMHNNYSTKKLCKENTEACDFSKWQIFDEVLKNDFRTYVYCCDMPSAEAAVSTINSTNLKISILDGIFKLD